MNRRVIAFLLGHILLLEAAVMLPALAIAIFMKEILRCGPLFGPSPLRQPQALG